MLHAMLISRNYVDSSDREVEGSNGHQQLKNRNREFESLSVHAVKLGYNVIKGT
jgi:hypothetical protein